MKSVFLRDEGIIESQEGLYFIPVRMGVRPLEAWESPARGSRGRRWMRWAALWPSLLKEPGL
jgi:hypothetical protein